MSKKIIDFNYQMKEKITDEEACDYLNNYLDSKIKIHQSNKNNLKELSLFLEFAKNMNIKLTDNLLIQLFESNKVISGLIKRLLKNNPKINLSGVLSITSSPELISLIELYFMLNNIDVYTEPVEIIPFIQKEIAGYIIESKDIENTSLKGMFSRIKHGDTIAQERLVNDYLSLVLSIANTYCYKELDLEELFEEGTIGLVIAINKYVYSSNHDFKKYASWWIKRSIESFLISKSESIKITNEIEEQQILFMETKTNITLNSGQVPSLKEIAKKMNITLADAIIYNELINKNVLDKINRKSAITISAEEELLQKELLHIIEKIFKSECLTKQEAIIIMCRYGFYRKTPMTIDEVSKILKISYEEVALIEMEALKKLKSIDAIKFYYESDQKSESSNITIYDFFNVPQEIVDESLKYLTKEELKILKMRFGENLDTVIDYPLWDKEEKITFDAIILPRLESHIYTRYNPNTGYTKKRTK